MCLLVKYVRSKFSLILWLFFLFILSFPSLSSAQKSLVSGVVSDAKTHETLPGASILVAGTTIGTTTDIDGHFELTGLVPGTVYTLVVSYVSYETLTIPNIRLTLNERRVLDVGLKDASLQLNDVVVVAQRRLDTEISVLNAVRSSLPVANGISSQQISRTQDSDASEVLSRIPGVTIIDGRFVVVRGLAQRYNNVWLNNATTPSSETDSRAFSFDVLPSSLIDNLMVYKSSAPELPADFSGGFVKVLTRNVPDNNSLSVQYATGYNTNATLRDFRLAEGSATDWVGFGAGARQIPGGSPAHLNDVSTAGKAAFTQQINDRWGVRQFVAIPDQKLSFVMNRVIPVGDYKLGNVTSLSYGTEYDYQKMSNNRYQSYDLENDQSRFDNRYTDEVYQNTVKLGALFNWMLQAGDNKYEFRNFFNQRSTTSLIEREGTDYYSDLDVRYWESLYTARTTYAGQLSGDHKLKEDVSRIDWTAGYSYAKYSEPDRKYVYSKLNPEDSALPYRVDEARRYYQELNDHAVSGAVNYEYKFRVSDWFSPSLHAGAYAEYKMRDFDARRFGYNMLGNGYSRDANWTYDHLFADGNIAADRIYLIENTNKSDAYTSDNLIGAVYAATKLNLDKKLDAYLGVRMEYNKLSLDGYEADGIKPVHIRQNDVDLFPSVNVAYHPAAKHLVRLAYGRSVNRAEFREIVPYVYYDFKLFANISGNLNLKNAYANNLDLRYEFYPTPGETVSLGAFYKAFSDPIEQTYHEAGSGVQYTFQNADRAICTGLELDVKKSLDFIGLNGLSLVFNGAYIYSKVFFAQGAFERDRPMQGQSPYLINTGVFYQHDKAGFSASVLYNRVGKRIETVGIPKKDANDDIPDVYEMPRNSLDLSFSQKIGKYVEIKGGVKNLVNDKVEYKQFLTINAGGATKEVEQPVRSYRPGMCIDLGVSVKF